jgi:DNA polymerase III epsilon subunit-like protein
MSDPTPLAFVDTECTGLDPDLHQIWEVGLIVGDGEHEWQLPVDLSTADPRALDIGQYLERRVVPRELRSLPIFAQSFAQLTWGCHLVGAVVSFDEERLRKLLRANGMCPGWHYHLVDCEALAAGKLGMEPTGDSMELSAAMGVDPDQFDRHTALGDARWAKALYEAVMQR